MVDPEDTVDKAVLRYKDGTLLKGYINEFSPEAPVVSVEEEGAGKLCDIEIDKLKAIFFVRSFAGNPDRNERKSYGISKPRGNRVFIRFHDNETLVGFLEGDVPWEKGFFLSKHNKGVKGFFIYPVDLDSNNIKVFVVASSVVDVTVVP